jgi:hypothetical protein
MKEVREDYSTDTVNSGHFKSASLPSVYELTIITHDTCKKGAVFLYRCETWYQKRRKEYMLRVLGQGCIIYLSLKMKEVRDLYPSSVITDGIKLMRDLTCRAGSTDGTHDRWTPNFD